MRPTEKPTRMPPPLARPPNHVASIDSRTYRPPRSAAATDVAGTTEEGRRATGERRNAGDKKHRPYEGKISVHSNLNRL
jgi:hypothetical protein